MGNFTRGLFIGLGISLLVTPKTGKEMRDLLVERVKYLRGIPPENEELKQSVQQMAERVQSAQQMANRAAQMGTTVQDDLSNLAQQTGAKVPQTGQDDDDTKPRRRPGA